MKIEVPFKPHFISSYCYLHTGLGKKEVTTNCHIVTLTKVDLTHIEHQCLVIAAFIYVFIFIYAPTLTSAWLWAAYSCSGVIL